MKTAALAVLLLSSAAPQFASAQARNNWWAIDWLDDRWLDFGASQPPAVVPLYPASNLSGFHGSISDTSGVLVLYMRPSGVGNSMGQTVPGPSPMWATDLGCQGSVFLPAHGTSRYGVFLTGQAAGGQVGAGFAEVDLSLNGGAGGVLGTGGRLLADSVLTSIAAMPHGNGSDYWGIFHARGSNAWYAFQYGPFGLDTVPVVSLAGAVAEQTGVWSSQIKCSPANDRIALHTQTDTLSVLAFDADMGTASDLVELVLPACLGGLEFSPSGRYLYAIVHRPDSNLVLQWDLWQSPNLIPTTETTVFATPNMGNYCSGMLLAPDGRIYFPQDQTSFLTRIGSPDQPGALCNTQVNAVDIAPGELTPFVNNHCKWYHDDTMTLGSAELVARSEPIVWPNPATCAAYVQLPENKGPWTLVVVDGVGRAVHSSFAPQGGTVMVPTAEFAPASYLVRAQGSRIVLFASLIVHH